MFYVKEKINDSLEVIVELNDENVYTKCPVCMEEMVVDLVEVLKDGDLFSTSVLCTDCSISYKNGEFGKKDDFHSYLANLHKEENDEKRI